MEEPKWGRGGLLGEHLEVCMLQVPKQEERAVTTPGSEHSAGNLLISTESGEKIRRAVTHGALMLF